MPQLLQLLVGIFTGKAGEQIGGAVSSAAQIAAFVAAVTPIALWLGNNKDAVFIQLTYGDLAFWGTMIAVIVFITVRLVHRAPAP
jgi:hypothetical protein